MTHAAQIGEAARPPGTKDLLRSFGRIGVLSFGGPAAQIALMHQELVDRRGWLSDRAFADALAFCMVLPGPEAMQLATYCGWRLRGVPGGLLAGGLFVLPGALVIACLALLYGHLGTQGWAMAALLGIKTAVIIIVVQALVGLVRRAITGHAQIGMAMAAFGGLWLLHVPFPLVIALAAGLGWLRTVQSPASPAPPKAKPPQSGAHARSARRTLAATTRTAVIWGTLWALPLLVLALTGQDLLWDIAVFFGVLAVVTFGGAYAVLAYMAQQV
ncbi:MAG: chromate transporter, partial [Primorskyibacter sp.]